MPAPKAALLIDDDGALRSSLSEQLDLDGEFETTAVGTGEEGLEVARSRRFEIVLLDVGLPDLSGHDVCRLLREGGVKVPVIMLTAQGGEADTVRGLESGANDYVTKPFRLAVLVARMRAQLREHEQSEDIVFTLGRYSFRPAAKLLEEESSGEKVRLTEKETAILKYLYRAAPEVVSRDTLLSDVWGYNSGVTTHTLETHVYRLRQKMEQDPGAAVLLVTEPGGYRLVC